MSHGPKPIAHRRVAAHAVVAAVALATLSSGCSQAGLRRQYIAMRPNMMQGNWQGAVSQLEASKEKVYGKKDRVMYWLNMATLLHYAGDPKRSQEFFVKAEAAMDDLWTTSITAEASKVLLNETAQSYPGEDFEKVQIYLFTSLNHAQNGNLQDALVEARRADGFLQKLKVHFEKEGLGGTVYTQDAFMLWLVGLYYEMEGSTADAFSAYKSAYMTYKREYSGAFGTGVPKFLGEDLVRTATKIGRMNDVKKIKKATGARGDTLAKAKTMGEVIVVHANGESPQKTEMRFNARMEDGYVMSVAVPKFKPTPPQIAYAKVSAGGNNAVTEVAQPISQIAVAQFEKRLPAAKARATARAVLKYAATKGAQAIAEKAGGGALGSLVGLAANITAVATEAADLRSWTLLPSTVNVGRLWVPAGQATITVSYHNASGAPIGRTDTFNIDIKPGQRKLISVRSLR